MKSLLLCVVMLAAAAFGQTAKVVQLSPADATKAKALHEAVLKAQAEEHEFSDSVADKYLGSKERFPETNTNCEMVAKFPYYKFGGCREFEYSEDYRFIVPKPPTPPSSRCGPFPYLTPARVTEER